MTLTPTARREAVLKGMALEQHPERAFVRTPDGYTPAPGYVLTHTPGVGWYHRHESEPERTIRFYDPLAPLVHTEDAP